LFSRNESEYSKTQHFARVAKGSKSAEPDAARVERPVSRKLLTHWAKYVGGIICTMGGIYVGNGYGAGYWRFGPFNLAWDTAFRGIVLVLIGFLLIRLSK
jgi:hypothetical protein